MGCSPRLRMVVEDPRLLLESLKLTEICECFTKAVLSLITCSELR
jgi:hypothetical protein